MRPPHIHDFYELLIVLDGEIHQLIEKTDFVFHSGSCCLMNHNIVHKEIFSSDATLLFIGMSKELVQQLSEDEPKVYFPDIEMPGDRRRAACAAGNTGSCREVKGYSGYR